MVFFRPVGYFSGLLSLRKSRERTKNGDGKTQNAIISLGKQAGLFGTPAATPAADTNLQATLDKMKATIENLENDAATRGGNTPPASAPGGSAPASAGGDDIPTFESASAGLAWLRNRSS